MANSKVVSIDKSGKIKSVPTDAERSGFTPRAFTTAIPNPPHGKGLADGLRNLPGTENK